MHRIVSIGTFLSGLLAASTALASNSCEMSFPMTATHTIGAITPGDQLTATVAFQTGDLLTQEGDTLSYYATGKITVTGADGSQVSGEVRNVHVMRTAYTADYISIDASSVVGALGGETRYEDPMLVTLYASPGTLPGDSFPPAQDWQLLDKRRTFQVHTPDTMDIFAAKIDALEIACS